MAKYFNESSYLLRRKVLKLLGGAFHIYNTSGEVVGYAEQKAFKMKEEINLYASEEMEEVILSINARNIIDVSATYDVQDKDGNMVGSLQRKGLKSILKDEWLILDTEGNEIGKVKEDHRLLAILRRFITSLIPQDYGVYKEGDETEYVNLKQNFNPFVYKLYIDFQNDPGEKFNRSLIMAAGVLLAAIEGKQS